ncbi:RPEL repeat protein [Paragonimus heterotremus]|uniref:RPEL repeat protein n=1 Tax=Paragonimus heterotremus TaxID=100268 RepID=A0A8J4SNP3_9TREM|nr:RPEL repeat protein [Paragonimus heterotremus]
MSTDSSYKKSGSPQASTEVSSLQANKLKNKETLERRLRCRRPIKELVNQGILLNPCISNADKVRQLQRAKTSDLLKQKIEKRPDRQYLVSRRIIRDDKPGTSPYILEQCHNLEKYQLKSCLNCKLTARPGTLELIEKGVLQVDPGVDSLIRCGSIPYPRVENISSVDELPPSSDIIPTPPPLILKPPSSADSSTSGCSKLVAARSRSNNCNRTAPGLSTNSRSMKDETIVYKLGSLVFHNYCPKSVSPNMTGLTSFQQKQKAREAQQAEMLRLQDTARAHRMVEQELSKRVAQKSPNSISQTDSAASVPLESGSEAGDSLDWISAFSSPVSELSDPHNIPVSTESSYHLCDSQLLCSVSQVPMSNSSTSTLWAPVDSSVYYTSTTVSSDRTSSAIAFRNTGSLEQLTANQLRAECRERKLARSGSKATLIRQLEPYRHEINCKYFFDPDPKSVHCTVNKILDSSTPNWLLNIQPKCSPPPSFPPAPPMWTLPVNSCVPSYSAANCQNVITPMTAQTSTSSGTVFLCPAPVRENTMATTVNTPVLLVSPSLSYPLNFGGIPLKHSLSVPYMSEISQTQQAATCALPVGSSIPTSCISRSAVSFSIPNTTLPVNNLYNQTSIAHIDRSQMSSLSNPVVQPSAILITPSVLPFTHAASAVDTSTTPGVAPSWLHSTRAENSTVISNRSTIVTPNLMPNTVYTLNPPICTVSMQPHIVHSKLTTSSSHPSNIQSIKYGTNPFQSSSSSAHSTGQPPSLNQIEEIWLRIRQLRRQIAKERAMESWHTVKSETDGSEVLEPNLLHDLMQEHDRLAVLCRLLVIDRIDALDELIDSGVDDSGSFNSPSSVGCSPMSRLQVERNLMNSYLRKLGGSALVNQISSPMHNGLRRASSPSLNSTHLVDSCCVLPTPVASLSYSTNYQLSVGCNSADAHSVMTTSTPQASLPYESINLTGGCTIPTTLGSRMHLALSWSDGLQKLDGHSTDRLIYSSQAVTDASMGCPISNSETLEPAPSPSTVDAFFELWNSVFKDSTKGSGLDELNFSSEQTNCIAESLPTVSHLSTAVTQPTVQTFLSSCPYTNHNQRLSSLQSPSGYVNDNSHLLACDSSVYRSSPTSQVQKDPLDEHMKSPLAVSRPAVPFDWPSLVSSPCTSATLSNDRQTKYADSCRAFQTSAPVIDLAEALFASLGTEVMDTSESSFCVPSVAMNWSVDA